MPVPTILLAYLSLTHPAVVAQATTEAGPWLTALNLGLAGIGLWLFATGKIHSDRELQRLIERADTQFQRVVAKLDAAEAELRERNQEARDTLVPTLTKAMLLLSRFVDRAENTPPPPSKR